MFVCPIYRSITAALDGKQTKIQGKTALITGASRGIGRAIALEFARQGAARLILLSRNPQRLDKVAKEIKALNEAIEAIPLAVNLTQTSTISSSVARAWQDHGPIHILVNNAGVAHQVNFLNSRLQDIEEEVNVNLLGMYAITRQIAQRMAAQQEGTIVNVSSLMGKLPAPSMATYSATKSAILGFSQALRAELAAYGIRVVSLLPSLTETDMVQDIQSFGLVLSAQPEQVAKALVRGLNNNSKEILVGWQSKAASLFNRLAPGLMEKVILLSASLSGSPQRPFPNTPEAA